MVNMFALGALERVLVKNLNKMIFSDSPLVTHHREVKTKTWLIDRQNNVSEWNNMSTCGFISQALVSFKKYMPPPLPYFKVNIYPFPLPHFASIFLAYL